MKLTIVGCSGSTSGPESPASSYLIQAPFDGRTFSFVVDLGPGAIGAHDRISLRERRSQRVDRVGFRNHDDHVGSCRPVLGPTLDQRVRG